MAAEEQSDLSERIRSTHGHALRGMSGRGAPVHACDENGQVGLSWRLEAMQQHVIVCCVRVEYRTWVRATHIVVIS